MQYRNEALELLTEGYSRVAQMSVALAYQQGYIGHPDYAIVNGLGDETSAGLPYFIDITFDDKSIWFFAYDHKTKVTIQQDYQVLVYRRKFVRVAPDTQIDMLEEFALQFPENSFIRKFLTYELIEWLRRNKANPNIYGELLHMKDASYRLEDHLRAFENLYNDQFPY